MNQTKKREAILNGLLCLQPKHLLLFKRLYVNFSPDLKPTDTEAINLIPIEKVVEEMPGNKLSNALSQVEATIDKMIKGVE